MTGKKVLDKIPYPVMVVLREAVICAIISLFCCLFQNLMPPFICNFIDSLAFDLSRFSDAVISLNFGLVFAVFLAIFISDNSPFIQDARRHSAFRQPLAIVIANSMLLCFLSSFLPKDVLAIWLFVMYECIIVASNTIIMWDLVTLSGKGQVSSANRDKTDSVMVDPDKEKSRKP